MTSSHIRRVVQVAERWPTVAFSVIVETKEAAAALPPVLSFFVDINPGMHRTGMPLEDAEAGKLVEVAAAGEAAVQGSYKGIHFYDGHSAGMNDLEQRRDTLWRLYERLLALDDTMSEAGQC